ncbi:MAG: 3-carboxy-cis,cis-muconate cycloisomerase [Rhizobiaceae bacterium]
MSTDPFSHIWLSGLFSDDELAECLSAANSLQHMLAVESAYARALGKSGVVESQLAEEAAGKIEAATPDITVLKEGTGRDGVVVPSLVAELKATIPNEFHSAIHSGMTSQDIIDTSLVLTLKQVCTILSLRLVTLSNALDTLSQKFGERQMQGRTRMQAAQPITVADRIRTWNEPLASHLDRLKELSPRLLVIQLGGAVGDRAALKYKAAEISSLMADQLNIGNSQSSWHTKRDNIVEFAGWLSLVAGTLGKMGQDIVLMAQQGVDEIVLETGGQSSAMPHKRNPISAELLATLARFNATQISGMHQAMVHEQERSGAAWTLEWMILPQMIMTTGCALNTAIKLAESISDIGADMK